MTQPRFLQTYIVPICLIEAINKTPVLKRVIGTAFLINGIGHFLTARHVIEQAYAAVEGTELGVAVLLKGENGSHESTRAAFIHKYIHAPDPYDLTLGFTGYKSPTWIKLEAMNIAEWQDVAMLGYPVAAVGGEIDNIRINLRALKGYVQRLTAPSDMKIGKHPDGFELSFNISPGMSGAPLFVPTDDGFCVVGVGVSSFRGETIEAEIEEIQEDGSIFKESRRKIEEFGFAHDIRPLLEYEFGSEGTLRTISKMRSGK